MVWYSIYLVTTAIWSIHSCFYIISAWSRGVRRSSTYKTAPVKQPCIRFDDAEIVEKIITWFWLKIGDESQNIHAYIQACKRKHPSLVALLLHNQANVDVKDKRGRYAIHLACTTDTEDAMFQLSEHKGMVWYGMVCYIAKLSDSL